MSPQEAADELHLDLRVIEAIEANRFAALGAPVYAKGYLRKYALLLGLAPEEIISRYQALGDVPAVAPPVPMMTSTPLRHRRLAVWVALSILIGGLVVLFVWQSTQELDSDPVISAIPPSQPPAVVDDSASQPPTIVSNEPEPTPAQVQTAISADQPAAAVAAARPAATGEQVTLRLEFTAPCWVEIHDAAGNRLMFDIGQPGAARTVSGQPPLKVVLGVASAVEAQVDGRPFVIPRRAGQEAARFTVDASGEVR
jgi:cytoskeleton protein RodZ